MSQNTLPETALYRTTPKYWTDQVTEAAAANGPNDDDDLKHALEGLHYNLGRHDHEIVSTWTLTSKQWPEQDCTIYPI
jgi:hypothetical protein